MFEHWTTITLDPSLVVVLVRVLDFLELSYKVTTNSTGGL
jgi:hypothetical protein